MPIKLNLLAESQAAEEQRRKDPVKRAIGVGALVVFTMLIWSAVLYSKSIALKSEQKGLEETWKGLEPRYLEVTGYQQSIAEFDRKVAALDRYYTNRFLWGSTLNAFQQAIPPLLSQKIQVLHLYGAHEYFQTEAVPAKKKGATTAAEPGKPATSRESITMTVDARDYGNPADQNYNKFKNALISVPYFKEILPIELVTLKSVTPPTKDLVDQKEYVQFTLECKLPPVIRNE